MLPLKEIRLNGGTQMREEINQTVLEDYAEIFDELPPVIVFDDGKHKWLSDGFHRYKASVFARCDAILCEVRKGSRRDAVLYAAGANASHGLRRSNGDKRKAIMALLSDKEWARWSDREIARQCQVSKAMVHVLRREVESPSPDPNRRRLALRAGQIISTPVEKERASANGSQQPTSANGGQRIQCPFCKKRFEVS
jgi:hypothetical protein